MGAGAVRRGRGLVGAGAAFVFTLNWILSLLNFTRLHAGSLNGLLWGLIGAGALLGEFAESPAELRKQVTSPGGTTAAALDVLMSAGGMPDLMRKAVDAAVRRGAELSREAEKKG